MGAVADALLEKYGINPSSKPDYSSVESYKESVGAGRGLNYENTLPKAEPKPTYKTAMDMQKKKEDQEEDKRKGNVLLNQKIKAKEEYDAYMASEEKKQTDARRNQKARQQQMIQSIVDSINGNPGGTQVPLEPDEKEERLRAARDQAEAEYNASEDQKVIEHDLEAITGLSEEERRQLEAYAVGRDVDYYDTMNMAQNGFQMGRAQQKAAGLIDKYGQERVDQMANTLSRQNNAQLTQQIAEMGQKHGDEHAVLGSIGSVAANTVGGVMGTMDYMKELGRNDQRFRTLDPNAMGNVGNVYAGAVRGQVQQNIEGEDPNFLRKAASIGYQGVMSAADSVARAYLGGGALGGAALAATGSFSQTMAEASKRGATPAQAALLATTTAGIEAASEVIPLDQMIRIAKGKGAATVLKNVLRQAAIEATTEEISLLGTVLMDAAIMQEKSEYQLSITSKIMQGISPKQARDMANREILDEAMNTALVSMVSGGASALGGSYAEKSNIPVPPTLQEVADAWQEQNTETQEAVQPQKEAQPVQKSDGELVQDTVANLVRQKQAAEAQTETTQPQQQPENAVQEHPATAQQDSTQQTDTQTAPDTASPFQQEQSAEGGQIKGTGAAEQNFTGKAAYNEVLSEENAQPDRKTDVRSMELPKQDINGGNVSATTANVYGSQNTPDDLAGAMEEPVARGDFSYVRITNDAATQRAQQEIEKAGDWETARANFGKDVEIGIAGAEMSARGALILNHAAEVYQQAKDSGDVQAAARAKKEWLTILADVQKLGTNTAQGLQAMKIIRNLMPQDKLQFAQIAVDNMVRDMRLNNAIQIDQQLIAEYENATTDQQRDEVMEKIQQNVADQIPSTLLDKWNALRYTNMLGNLKTTVRNVAGNVGNTAVYRLKDLTGGIIETIANKVTKGKTGRTKSVVVNKKLQKSLDNYYQQVKSTINSGGKYGEGNSASGDFAQGVMDKRRIFKSNSKNETVRKAADFVMAPMEGYRKATNWMMNNDRFGDEAFGKAAFTHAMAGYLQANGVKTEADIRNADPDLIDKAMAYAVKEAQETTFHDNSALANVLGKLKKDAGVVGEGIMPFTKTPANVLTRAEEYSPLGIINTAIKTAQKAAGNTQLAEANGRLGSWAAKGQDITGTDIINSLSKTLTGTGIFALGAILKSNGILNGGPDEDDEQATFDQMNGQQPYSINLPDGTNYTLDWLTPVAMPLFMGAQFMDIAADKDLTFADLEKIFTSIADPMLQMSMLQGMNDSLDNIKYSENNLGQFFINAAVSYLTQGLTNTLLGQLERSTEENRQTTFIDKDSNVPEWMQKQLGKASQKIPGWDYQQIDYKNAWGETEKNEGGLGYNLLSPGYSSKVRKDSVTDEINRLNKAQSESVLPSYIPKTVSYRDSDGTYHENYRLSEEEYQQMAQTQGQSAREILEKMVEHSSYQAMDDDMRATAMKMVYSYAREKAMHETLGTTYSTSWMMGLSKGTEASRILMEVADNELNKALSNIKTARTNNYSKENQAAYERELDEVYNSFKGMDNAQKVRIMESATGDTKKYLEVRSKGVTTKQYLDTTAKIDKLRPEPGYTTVRDIQTREAIAKMPGISDRAKDTLMKAYMTDYDPNAKSPQTTELKYDYARQELGLAPSEYTDVYRVQLDGGKKNEKIADWMAMGYTRAEANMFYRLFAATGRTKIDVVDWYNSQ